MIPKELEELEEATSREDWPRSEELMLVLLETDGDNASLWYNLGLVRTYQHHYEDAVAAFDRTLELSPKHAHAMYQRANAQLELQEFYEALNGFAAFVAESPEHDDGLISLARIALHLEEAELALSALEKRADINNDAENIIGAAEAMQMMGREDGIALLRRIYVKNPGVRPELLKIMSQGSVGRVPLTVSRLLTLAD